MSRLFLLISVLAATSAGGCSGNDIPKATLSAMQHADRFELLSLEPDHAESPPPGHFHRWKTLGQTVISDVATQKKLTDALRAGARENSGMAAACFNPRHGIRVVSAGRTFDLVICFECLSVMTYDGDQRTEGFLVSRSPQPLFDEVLRAAGVPLATKHE